MWILALGAILFLIGGIGAIVGRDVPNIIATFSISGTLAVLFAFIWREGGKANSFLAWLFGNSEEISNYSATYEGYPMLWTTEVTHFQASISALVITAKVPSRYLVVGHHNTFVIGFAFSLLSLIFGWWGIPRGPIYTVQTLWRNLRGGNKQTLAELLDEISREIEPAEA